MGIINTNLVICPGCGKVWKNIKEYIKDSKYEFISESDYVKGGDCPECKYENGVEPYRLLTIGELMEDKSDCWCDVALGKFLNALVGHKERL